MLSFGEVGRALLRRDAQTRPNLDALWSGFDLIPVSRGLLEAAAHLGPPLLRTLDAIHIASAMPFGPDLEGILTYDLRMQQAARANGLIVRAPGTRP